MIRYSQFNLNSVQAVVYTPNGSRFSQTSVLASVLGRYPDRFNGPVQALPLPDDAPAEIPRVILQSTNGMYKLQAGPARIDSFWMATQGANPDQAFSCTEVLEHYVRTAEPPLRVGRVALVLTRTTDDANPAQSLIERFCNEESRIQPFNNSEHFEIHNQKRYQLQNIELQINCWVRCKAVTLLQPEPRRGILVEQDINTLEEDAIRNVFDADRLRDFFAHAAEEANSILHIYFPEEE